ncbi:MAG: hypothetical protein QME64_05615, partial [bacterium]|nr:hypothetical protein [bacterium]
LSIATLAIAIKRRKPIWILDFGFWILLPVVPWLIRNWFYTHNPIYPLLSSFFSSPHSYDIAGKNFASIRSLPPMNGSAIFDRIWGSFAAININGNGILTAFFLICIPLLIIKTVPRQMKWLTGYGLLAWLIYAVVEGGTDGRFIYPTYPILAIAIGYALHLAIEKVAKFRPASFILRPSFFVILLCIIMLGTFIHLKIAFVQDFNESWLPVFGKQQQEKYIAERIKIYPMLQYINQKLPNDARVLLPSGYAALYCNRRYLAQSEFDISPLNDWITRYDSADQVYAQLRDWSITHIIIYITPAQNPVLTELLSKYSENKIELCKYALFYLKR